MARVAHPYKFRAFRTLSFLLYLRSPFLERKPGGHVSLTSISAFALRIHLQANRYVREDLQALAKLGLLQDLELGINRATFRIQLPAGMVYEEQDGV